MGPEGWDEMFGESISEDNEDSCCCWLFMGRLGSGDEASSELESSLVALGSTTFVRASAGVPLERDVEHTGKTKRG